ncbi:MAG TPA: transcription elongation factor GreA [Candidatus Paceibacterota bacterium]
MTTNKEYLSQEKYKEIELELEELSTNRRREIAESLEQAKSLGDLRENSEYQEARAAQAALEERIAYLSDVLKRAVIVQSHHSTKVEVGSTVRISKAGSKEEKLLRLVGSSEANVAEGKVSNESPIGMAMMGKKKGESFHVKTLKGLTEYNIIDIE